jgi:uncharacterized Zn-finger protein
MKSLFSESIISIKYKTLNFPIYLSSIGNHPAKLLQNGTRFASSDNKNVTPVQGDKQINQAPNRTLPWSATQRKRKDALGTLRFEGINLEAQPKPPAGINLLNRIPVELVESRTVSCDGGGSLGHPRIFINLVGRTF